MRKFLLLLILFLLSAGCSARSTAVTFTSTAAIATTTLSPTLPSVSSDTPLPPPPQPTIAPVEGITATQVNVRSEPSTAGDVLGIIAPNTKVQITGRDPAGNWWQILYPQGGPGKGWVTSQYVTTANGTTVPVVGGEEAVDPGLGGTAVIQQQINVRSGPGTGFNSLGTLNPRDVVRLTGKDPNSAWLQIEFSAGPEGRGWVSAAFVQAQGVESLPIISEAGKTIGTGTPTGVPPTPTPTVVPARDDQDTQNNPIASVVFKPLGTQTLIYSGDVSAPLGDAQDWIQFTSEKAIVFASLECKEDTDLQGYLYENGQPSSLDLACGDVRKPLAVQPGLVYTIQLKAPQFSGGLRYFPYTVKIQASP